MLANCAVEEFKRACDYLLLLDVTKTLNRKLTSYNLKHCAERYHRRYDYADCPEDAYISNGMLLAAAYHLGLLVRRTAWSSFVGYLNVSSRSIRALEDETKPRLPQPEVGQPFRVLGYDHGRFFYLPMGTERVITLRAQAHTPANLLRLAPLGHWTRLFPPRSRRAPFDSRAALCSLIRQAYNTETFDPTEYRQ